MGTVLFIIEMIGIVSFAAAGAMVAIDKETDLFGVIFLSVITCFGGGLLRDTIASDELPIFFTELKLHIIVCIFVAFCVFMAARILKEKYVKEEANVERINNILDALGIGIFSASGTAMYLERGALVAIILGMLSSVGGSIIRDMMLREIPFVLRKRVYAVATLIGSAVYYIVAVYIIPDSAARDVIASVSCIAVIFTIRMCATHFKWNMPKAIIFSEIAKAKDSAQTEQHDAVTK